jgi:hypothetical protein
MEQFSKLTSASTCRIQLTEFATSNSTKWIHKNAFDIAMVPKYIIENDTVVVKLIKEFNAVPVIFRMPPWQFYRFHTDAIRSCALNMLLVGADSQTYYGTETNDEEVLNIRELNYEPDCYYLLNTHQKHSVINRNNTRYMFSLGFNEPLTYNIVKEFCEANNI